MTFSQSVLALLALIAACAFFSIAEIAMAASRRLRLRQMADDGDARAQKVMRIQEQPGNYFTVVQVGVNALAILGGIVGEGMLSPYFTDLYLWWLPEPTAGTMGFLTSFLLVTSLFILGADLMPKRLSMAIPEELALSLIHI